MFMAASSSSINKMDAWSQRRGLQTVNLRSVFTAEQQRILERYYENGMTNQSKACFQLILQCAQEAKLDFSVVRTWVGNKRRKLASKVEQNGGVSHSLSSHGLASGLLSNHTLPGSALSSHSLVAGPLLPAEIAAARNIQNRIQLLPPASSFPSFSSTSSSPSSSSSLSSGSNNNNNNDVILTGIYSLNSVPRSRPRPLAPPSQSDSEHSAHTPSSLINKALQSRNSSTSLPLHSKLVSLSQTIPSLTPASQPLVYTAVRKGASSLGEAGVSGGAGTEPQSWIRQYSKVQILPGTSSSQSQTQTQPRPPPNPQPQEPTPQKTPVSPVQNTSTSYEQMPRIQQAFSLSERTEEGSVRPSQGSTQKGQQGHRPASHPLDTSPNFSIAMETGDEEDEWQREEELANMAAQTHINREQMSGSPTGAEVSVVRGRLTPPMASSRSTMHHSDTTLQGNFSITAQTSLIGESSSQTSVGVSSSPWVNNSRKRTLQDRTQFSDGDLIQLKHFWDRGMTSLGSVCREKINAAANQLGVDTEIVKTWISNRRRKYRLMGIEIPPPKGGPAVFTASSPGNESSVDLSPDEEHFIVPKTKDDLNDSGSVCLSEDGTTDSQHRDQDEGMDGSTAPPLVDNVKIEVIDEDEDDSEDYNGELVSSDIEQMQSLLEFKHEEVQFLENELENQKQKYQELASFTKSLLSALRNNDLERQQELMASLPQPSDQDWDITVERGATPFVMSGDVSSNHDNSPVASVKSVESSLAPVYEEVKLVLRNKDNKSCEVTEPSASEEQLQGAVSEEN